MHDLATNALWPVALGVLGAVFGSFTAALAIRWPQERSVLHGRSACDACEEVLGPAELVPLLSAALAGGKCRRCGAPINPLHWRVELAGLATGALAAVVMPGAEGVAAAVFGWLLLALVVLDITEFWLPDALTVTLALAGIVAGLCGTGPDMASRLIGGAAGFGALWLVGAGYKALRGREGLGGGDPKLLGAIGLWTGWQALPAIVVLACMIGLGVVLFWVVSGRQARLDDRLPFGALLGIAAYASVIAMLGVGR